MMADAEIQTLVQNRTVRVRLLLITSAGLIALGLWRPAAASAQFGWILIMGLLGLSCLIGIASLMPGCSYLQLSPEGMVVCTCWRRTHYQWSDFAKIGVMSTGVASRNNLMVGVILSASAPTKHSLPVYKQHNLERYGYEFALPSDYGTSVEQLVETLNEWRTRHAVAV